MILAEVLASLGHAAQLCGIESGVVAVCGNGQGGQGENTVTLNVGATSTRRKNVRLIHIKILPLRRKECEGIYF